jgi:hypothetical protein
MTSPAEVAAIAAKLTKAQRECLLAMKPPGEFGRVWRRARNIPAAGSTLSSLRGFGGVDPKTLLLGPILVTADYGPAGAYWSLTDDGLAVRVLLEKEDGDEAR